MTNELIETKAFKCMKQNLTGHGVFQFSVGEIYEIAPEKEIVYYESGFYACINLVDCFEYHNNEDGNRFSEVTIFGDYKVSGSVICGRKIRIDKEINLAEYLNGEFIDYHGNKRFYVNGKRHRDGDLPAVIWSDGTKGYYINGKMHRDGDLPAVIWSDGTKGYYINGKMHRDGDLPAVISPDGTMGYYVNGQCHRDGDLPAIMRPNGYKAFYKNGKFHRDGDLPAIIRTDGHQEYYVNGTKYIP